VRVLIVEDDAELQSYIRAIFQIEGYEYESAYDELEYKKIMDRGEKFDLALLDLNLGAKGQEGIEIARDIKEKYPEMAAIILSALCAADLKIKMLSLGVDDYVCKPFYDEELLSRIKRVAARRNIQLPSKETRMKFDDSTATAIVDGNKVELEKDEYLILKVLSSKHERGIKWDYLFDIVYDESEKNKAYLDEKVAVLREKLSWAINIKDVDGFYSLVYKLKSDAPNNENRKKILIVDDDENTQELLKSILEEGNYECFSAFEGNDGLRKIYEVKPDLVILDIQIPGINGFKLCELIRKINKTIPLVIITGRFIDPSDRALGLDLGADDYLSKSTDPGELLARIRTIITAYDLLRKSAKKAD